MRVSFLKPGFNFDRKSYLAIRWLPLVLLLSAFFKIFSTLDSNRGTFVFDCASLWLLPVIAILWYSVSNYVVIKWRSVFVSIVVPTLLTLYLCDKAGSIDQLISIFSHKSLSAQKLFIFLTNVTIVLACCAFERAFYMLELYPQQFAVRFIGYNREYFGQLLRAYWTPDYALSDENVINFQYCLKIFNDKIGCYMSNNKYMRHIVPLSEY